MFKFVSNILFEFTYNIDLSRIFIPRVFLDTFKKTEYCAIIHGGVVWHVWSFEQTCACLSSWTILIRIFYSWKSTNIWVRPVNFRLLQYARLLSNILYLFLQLVQSTHHLHRSSQNICSKICCFLTAPPPHRSHFRGFLCPHLQGSCTKRPLVPCVDNDIFMF